MKTKIFLLFSLVRAFIKISTRAFETFHSINDYKSLTLFNLTGKNLELSCMKNNQLTYFSVSLAYCLTEIVFIIMLGSFSGCAQISIKNCILKCSSAILIQHDLNNDNVSFDSKVLHNLELQF